MANTKLIEWLEANNFSHEKIGFKERELLATLEELIPFDPEIQYAMSTGSARNVVFSWIKQGFWTGILTQAECGELLKEILSISH